MRKHIAQSSTTRKPENLGGRPRKFGEPSKAVTVTLPGSTIAELERIDPDRSRAIVKASRIASAAENGPRQPLVELVEVEKDRAVIIVGRSKSLQQLHWLRLVEIATGRFLLVIPTGTPVETLEVAVMDMLDALPETDEYERALLTELQGCLTVQRRSKKVSKAELLLIDVS